MALYEGDRNAFYDADSEHHLSKVAKAFIAGMLRHAREITAVCNQWVNSYKRLVPGYEAPVYICWARQNRSALLRIPTSMGSGEDIRVEFRSPDPACNPYLAFSLMLAAGLQGVADNAELPPPAADNIYEMTPSERRAMGIDSLPEDLSEAVAAMQRSELVRATLGDHVFEFFARNKLSEWDSYKAYVSPFEIERSLPVL